jgi:predicted DNA-binding transcriptional regulator YafY
MEHYLGKNNIREGQIVKIILHNRGVHLLIFPMTEHSQKARLIRILEMLSSGKRVSARRLKKEFPSVSDRTLQRDIQEIAAILPLEYQHINGREMEWFLPQHYRGMILPVVQQNELLAFHFLKSFIKNLRTGRIAEDIQALEKKLESLAPGDVLLPMESLDEPLIFNQNPGIYDYSDFDAVLERIIEAIGKKLWLELSYFPVEAEQSKVYQVFPHRLYTYGGSLYLLATFRHHSEPASLLLHFMQKAEISPEQPAEKPIFSKKQFTLTRFGVFSGEPVDVTLRIHPEIKRYFVGRIWHESQQITKNEDDSLTMTMQVPLAPDFISWILSWGRHIQVLSPPELIEKIKTEAQAMAEMYQTQHTAKKTNVPLEANEDVPKN